MLVTIAETLACRAHAGQTRRDGRTPYISHPARVAARVGRETAGKEWHDDAVAAAWLHDVLEDTHLTSANLRENHVPERVVQAVQRLTRLPQIPYDEYLSHLAMDPIARQVKIADILDNLGDDPTPKQVSKYARALNFLVNHPRFS